MKTEREYLVSLGLAQAGRGRFSAKAKEALASARANGMEFAQTATQIAKIERKAKPKTAPKPVVRISSNRPAKDSYDVKAVRAWGEKAGFLDKGARGKLPTQVILDYLAENGNSVPASPRKVVVRQPRSKVREETTAWAIVRRGPKDPAYVSEPLVAVSTCGRCTRGISYCGCDAGPVAPKYLGGELLMLTKPVK